MNEELKLTILLTSKIQTNINLMHFLRTIIVTQIVLGNWNEMSANEMRQIHMAMPVLEIKQKLNKYLQAIELQLITG